MLPLGERSAKDVEKCYDASIEGAKNLAACGADIVLLGGLPVNMSRGDPTDLMKRLSDEIGLPVTSSTTAQQKAYKALGSRKVGTVHPFKADQSFRHDKQLKDFFGLEPCGVVAGGYDLKTVGSIPLECAFEWARKLKRAHPDLDTMLGGFATEVVIDHMGRPDPKKGVDAPGFQALIRLLKSGRGWSKMSAPYRTSREAPPYNDITPFAHALVNAVPDRLVWGSDWPHVLLETTMPNDGDLVDQIAVWVPDEAVRKRILVDNPDRLYGFERA